MDRGTLIIGAVTALLGGGMAEVIRTLWQGRSVIRKTAAEASAIEQRAGVEAESIALAGAASAMTMLEAANERLVDENARLLRQLEHEVAHRERVEALAAQFREELDAATSALRQATARYAALEHELAALRGSTTGGTPT